MPANSVTLKLQGADSFKRKLLRLLPSVRGAVQTTVAQTALLVETDAKLFSPVDTGLNRAEIRAEIAPNGLSAEVVAGTEYAIFLEFGRRNQPAQPFMGPAFEKNRGRFLTLLKQNYKLLK